MQGRGWGVTVAFLPISLVVLVGPGVSLGQDRRSDDADEADESNEAAIEVQPLPDEVAGAEATRHWELALNGYLDIGFADAQGNGTSFVAGDTRVPADYVVDTFATAVNSRGDVASTQTDRYTNGFLPRQMGMGGRPSFLINNLNQDLRYSSADERLMVFARAQVLPRYTDAGNETRLFVEQAFARVVPFAALEMALTVGKFDSVFGIEYLDNPSTVRVGVTPSLIARYTTGQCVGAKLLYRLHIPALASSISVNASASNGGTQVESLQPVDISLTGRPVLAGRLGYELGLPRWQIKLGGSVLHGPRNDQRDSNVHQTNWGLDARIYVAGLSLSGEWIYFEEEPGTGAKFTGNGTHDFASGFEVRGFYVQAAYRLPIAFETITGITIYARAEQRRARFDGYPLIESRRLTPGVHLDLGHNVALKGEWLFNREGAGALSVANDVRTVSSVLSW
jgi:hypothetical protein